MPASTKDIHVSSATLTLEERPAPVVSEAELAAANPVFQFWHIPELDGFRGVAILLVIFGHLRKFSWRKRGNVRASANRRSIWCAVIFCAQWISDYRAALPIAKRDRRGGLQTILFAQSAAAGAGVAALQELLVTAVPAISYSLYLWQQLFLVTPVPWWGRLRDLALSVIVPILIAAASCHIVEKPILRIEDRLASQA